MANWKKILGWTGGVVLVGGMGFGGYKAYEYFKKQDKDLDDVKTKVERVERKVETIENEVDALAMYNEYFEYTLDSLGNVVDSAVVVAGRADSVARDANRNAKRAVRDAKRAQATADSALNCCNGGNNGVVVDTNVVKPVKPVKPDNSNKPVKPRKPVNPRKSFRDTVYVVAPGNNAEQKPTATQRTVVIVNGDTISNTTQVIRELNAEVKTWVETTRQRIR